MVEIAMCLATDQNPYSSQVRSLGSSLVDKMHKCYHKSTITVQQQYKNKTAYYETVLERERKSRGII